MFKKLDFGIFNSVSQNVKHKIMDGIVFPPKPQITTYSTSQPIVHTDTNDSHNGYTDPVSPIFSPLYPQSETEVVDNDLKEDQDITNMQPDSFAGPESLTVSKELGQKEQMGDISSQVSYADAKIQEIDITKIIPNPYQPRKIFDEKALQELADSIREHGVIQPLVVTETANGYELVVGERRFRASQLAGVAKVPAIVKKRMEDQTKLEVALIENIQRQELNPIEEAQAYDRLMKTFHLTQEQVAKKVGKSRPAVANTVRLLNLPAEIQRGVIEGKISEGHARALLGLPDTERQLQMFKLILEQGMNVRQVEQKVRELSLRRQLDSVNKDPKFIALESELRQKLSAQVKILRSGKGGKITIEFYSEDELKEILNRMSKGKEEQSSGSYITI